MNLEGKSVVVTGGSRGIGLVSAAVLLRRGARVTIAARSEASVGGAAAALDAGPALATVVADVATVDGCEAVAAAASDAFGAIDAIFTNAGLYSEAPIETVDEAEWGAVLDGNLKSAFFSIQAALPELRRARGSVVTMSSYHGLAGVGGVSVYGAAKAGVAALTRSLALELAPEVRVNCIAPGYIETEKHLASEEVAELTELFSNETPVGRMGQGEEIAAALLFALENEFLNGATLSVDGGRIAGPWLSPTLPTVTPTPS